MEGQLQISSQQVASIGAKKMADSSYADITKQRGVKSFNEKFESKVSWL